MYDVINASDLLQFTGLSLRTQQMKKKKKKQEKRQNTNQNRSETARLLVGFSSTRYESFPAGLHGIRTDRTQTNHLKTQTHSQRERNVCKQQTDAGCSREG